MQSLNISNIDFSDLTEAITTLQALPALRSLYINLFEEHQVDLIVKTLPNLEFLNSLPVDRQALEPVKLGQLIDTAELE